MLPNGFIVESNMLQKNTKNGGHVFVFVIIVLECILIFLHKKY